MECFFCGKTASVDWQTHAGFDAACDAGWIPSFVDRFGDDNLNPVCTECCKTNLRLNEDMGDFEVREETNAR